MTLKSLTQIGLLSATVALASCNGGNQKPAEVKSNGAVPAQESKSVNIAYVELDSIQTQYQFFIDAKLALEEKSKRFDDELNRLGEKFQKAAANFQQKAQRGEFTSQAEGEAAQKKVLDQQATIERKQAQYAQELAKDQMDFNMALADSVNSFIADYNKVHQYDMIISKAGGNLLYAKPSMNITADVVAGLNKRYNKK